MQPVKTRILYLGNQLLKHGLTPTSVETLGPLLATRYDMRVASSVKNKPLRLLHMLGCLFWNARRTDLVLIDTYSSMAFHFAWICAVVARWLGLPYIPILRGGDLPDRLARSPRLCRRFFGKAYACVVPSAYLMQHFQDHFQNLVYLPNNIPLKNYPFCERRSVKPRLLYVRAFHKIYNPTMAIRVLAQLAKPYPEATLCMIGPDKDGTRVEVEALARELGVFDRLELTGRMEKAAWLKKSENYDIFINTTDFDNHPVSVTEAMALGLPVVSTNAGGLPFLIEHDREGLLVNCNDVQAMTAAIASLVDQPEKATALARSARKKASQFDWAQLQNRWFELLDAASSGQSLQE